MGKNMSKQFAEEKISEFLANNQDITIKSHPAHWQTNWNTGTKWWWGEREAFIHSWDGNCYDRFEICPCLVKVKMGVFYDTAIPIVVRVLRKTIVQK